MFWQWIEPESTRERALRVHCRGSDVEARLLRSTWGGQGRRRGGDQEGVSAPCDEASSRTAIRTTPRRRRASRSPRRPTRFYPRGTSARRTTGSVTRASTRRAGRRRRVLGRRRVQRHVRRGIRRHLRRRPPRRSQPGASVAPICATSSSCRLEQAVFGDSVDIEMPTLVECRRCDGNGAEPGTRRRPARPAAARGRCASRRDSSRYSRPARAAAARGSGDRTARAASAPGRGRVRKIKTLEVKVPAGVDNGDRIRLSREGEAGATAGRPATSTWTSRSRTRDLRARGPELSLRGAGELRDRGARRHGRRADPRRQRDCSRCRPKRSRAACSGCAARACGPVRAGGIGDLFCRVQVETPVNLTAEQKQMLRAFDESLQNEGSRHNPRARSWFDGVKEFFERMGA